MLKRWMIWALAIILLFGALPEVLTQLAALFTSAFGCSLNEGSVQPCVVMGLDFGYLMYAMGLSFWFGMFTIPPAILALIVWLIVLVVLLFKRRHRHPDGMIWALGMILLFGASPWVPLLLAMLFGMTFGCVLDDAGSVHPCVVMGLDFGYLLYAMSRAPWFSMFTTPLAGLALIVWLIVLVVSLFKRRHRRADEVVE